jgi:hypothetical protein
VTLSWRAGREAASHRVYVSTDQQAVIDGTAVAVSVVNPSHSAALDLSSTYYWRVDEVNDVEAPSTWQGDVWSFSTSEYLAVDDFESYNDIDPPDPDSHRYLSRGLTVLQLQPTGRSLVMILLSLPTPRRQLFTTASSPCRCSTAIPVAQRTRR